MKVDSTTTMAGDAIFTVLDVSAVIQRLRVKELAEREALDKRPPEHATDLDVNERGIVTYYENAVAAERGRVQEKLEDVARQLKSRRNDVKPARDQAELARITAHMQEEHAALCQEESVALRLLRLEQERCLRYLRHFKSVNNLRQRDADYPESMIYHFAIVATIALAEWIALSSFYANGSDFGLLGGVLIAGTFSIVNLLLMVIAGFCFRYLNAPAEPLRGVYLTVAGVCCVFFLFITFIAAHYRVAVERQAAARLAEGDMVAGSDEFRVTQAAWESFLANPIGLSDAWAWIVVVFAITFGLFALYKGYTADDPFPGYKKMELAARRAAAEYADRAAAARSAQAALFDAARADLMKITANAKHTAEAFDKDIAAADSAMRAFEMFVDHAERNCNHVVSAYRQFNRYVAAAPRPKYFERPVALSSSLRTPLKDIDSELRFVQGQLHKDSEELDKRFTERSEALQYICSACAQRFEDLVKQIERDIQEEVAREPNS
jgi:hypothetical protein